MAVTLGGSFAKLDSGLSVNFNVQQGDLALPNGQIDRKRHPSEELVAFQKVFGRQKALLKLLEKFWMLLIEFPVHLKKTEEC